MTSEEISKLTLADLEAIAARFRSAVDTIREAQALLSGGPGMNMAPQAVPGPPPTLTSSTPTGAVVPDKYKHLAHLPEERRQEEINKLVERERFLQQWKSNPQREQLLAEMKTPEAKVEEERIAAEMRVKTRAHGTPEQKKAAELEAEEAKLEARIMNGG